MRGGPFDSTCPTAFRCRGRITKPPKQALPTSITARHHAHCQHSRFAAKRFGRCFVGPRTPLAHWGVRWASGIGSRRCRASRIWLQLSAEAPHNGRAAPETGTPTKAPRVVLWLTLLIPSLKTGFDLVYNRQPVPTVSCADSLRSAARRSVRQFFRRGWGILSRIDHSWFGILSWLPREAPVVVDLGSGLPEGVPLVQPYG